MANARAAYELKMQQTFAEDVRRADFQAQIARDKMLEGNAGSDERVANKRRARLAAEQAQERAIELRIQQAAQIQQQRALAEREDLLAAELEKRKNERVREEKIIEKVRNEAPELRELEQKLRAAYMNQERRKQLAEKATRIAIADLQLEARRIRDVRAEEEKQAARRVQAVAAKAVLREQMKEQDEAKAAAYAEFIKEKALVDEIIAKIMEEEKQEALAKMAKRKETIEYVQSYLRENEALKEAEKRRLEEEDNEILRYAENVRQREAGHAAKKAALEEAKDKIFQNISRDILRKQAEDEEMLELQIELANQEAEEKRVQADKAALERRLRDRMEMMAANEYQKKLKLEKLQEMEREEQEFRQRMLDKFAEDERIEQMNAQKRRMKQQEHKRQVELLLLQRKQLYEDEKAAEMEDQREEERRSKVLRDLIEQERQKILREAAGKLGLEYMPRGVLQTKEDFELFRRAAAERS
eukprot:CAMPEP_0206227742 /NCGR_PEP_ID=MMETSP0047_2-20121206/8789_1 /ASSEMBLY_ACC=CAM_ASM_000192 /TAXON_ID=195065 /ORGANISM="Chroomonas mesostigmatica_cf, Strain CCMP1168" /LENGTH=472 /DNA_ID=CAMNT_0053650921 /DNA_START=49 /DNA_END=1467 /DNA_ORIENTATION=-